MKLGLTLLLCLVLASVFQTTVSADVSVGVKPGDWVEYNVTFTGNPPPEHDAKWARMEVGTVEGQRVIATFTSRLANGTMLNVVEDLDFDTGRFIDLFIIPAGLNTDDTFYDQAVGNITIDSVEARICAGATRTVVHAEALDTQWYWDRATGVVVEARTSNPVYTLDTGLRFKHVLCSSEYCGCLGNLGCCHSGFSQKEKTSQVWNRFPCVKHGLHYEERLFFLSWRLLFFAKPPFQVFFSAFFLLFFSRFLAWSKFISKFHEFLLCHRQPAALADVMFGGYLVLHFSATFGAVGHSCFTLVRDSMVEGY
jgi:hypothetical protein